MFPFLLIGLDCAHSSGECQLRIPTARPRYPDEFLKLLIVQRTRTILPPDLALGEEGL